MGVETVGVSCATKFAFAFKFGGVVCTVGRIGEDAEADEEGIGGNCVMGRGRVRLGLGLGRLSNTLRRFPVGLGLRLLNREMGLVKPLWDDSRETGATMEMESRPSSSEVDEARISAALSRTEGTD